MQLARLRILRHRWDAHWRSGWLFILQPRFPFVKFERWGSEDEFKYIGASPRWEKSLDIVIEHFDLNGGCVHPSIWNKSWNKKYYVHEPFKRHSK